MVGVYGYLAIPAAFLEVTILFPVNDVFLLSKTN